jgi:hypothetical protein
MKAGGNKEIAGVSKLVTGDSSLIILFYCVFTKQAIWYYQDRKEKDLF